jgi:AsmA protein
MAKKLLIALGAVVGLIVLLVAGVWLFVDADQFRPKLEVMMSEALGRRVTIGRLRIALFSGGVAAEDLMIADDPAFSRLPFVTAKSVSVGVDLMPLIMSRSLRVESFRLDQPKVALLRSTSGAWNFSSLGSGASSSPSPAGTSMAFVVHKISVAGGQIVVRGIDGRREERSYDGVNVDVSDLSLTSSFPFTVTAKTPNGGTVRVEGNAGPFNQKNMAETPFGGTLKISQLALASTGFVDASSGIDGIVGFDGNLTSDGVQMKTKGKLTAEKMQMLPGSSPSRVPFVVDYESSFNTRSQKGTLRQGDVHVGKAIAHLTGDYDSSGKSPIVHMKLAAPQMPVSELEAALPAMGITLPPNATLKEGALDTQLDISGAVDQLTIAGPVKLSNGLLAGFDLGGKLGSLASFAGLKSGKDTVIETLGASLRMTPDGTAVDMLMLNVPAIGVLTGDGTISPKGAMNFVMLAKLSSGAMGAATGAVARAVSFGQTSGVPFLIQGTTSNPSFSPDMGRAAKNVASDVKDAVTKPENLQKAADIVGGLFGRKKQE